MFPPLTLEGLDRNRVNMQGKTVIQWNAYFVSNRKKELLHSREKNKCMSSLREDGPRECFRKEAVSEVFCQKTSGENSTGQTKAKRNLAEMLGASVVF